MSSPASEMPGELSTRPGLTASSASTGCDTAIMSPKLDFGSASRARTYAEVAAPAGETCLNEVATTSPVAVAASRTSCQAVKASNKLI